MVIKPKFQRRNSICNCDIDLDVTRASKSILAPYKVLFFLIKRNRDKIIAYVEKIYLKERIK